MDNIYNKKILITGSHGYIGRNLLKFFKTQNIKTYGVDVLSKTRDCKINIANKNSIVSCLKKIKPDIVIHCAALSSLVDCEKNPKLARSINFVGTKNIVDCLNNISPETKIFFLSSDYVFDGEKGNFNEDSIRKPKTVYGKTKLEAENYIKSHYRNYVICRTANIFGEGGNFFEFIKYNLTNSIKSDYFDDTFYTPTYIGYFLDSVFDLLNNNYKGVIHIAGKHKVSRYSFALLCAKLLGFDKNLISKSKKSKDGLISRDSSLDTKKITKLYKRPYPSLNDSLYYSLAFKIYPYMYFSDARGYFLGILAGENIKEINYIETKKNTIRGGHYHKKINEIFFILKGKVKIRLMNLKTKNESTVLAKKNDIIKINKNIVHYFESITDTAWINMLSSKIEPGKEDFYKYH